MKHGRMSYGHRQMYLRRRVGAALVLTATLIVLGTGTRALVLAAAEVGTQVDAIAARRVVTTVVGNPASLPPLIRWAGKVWSDPAQPAWKRELARRVVLIHIDGKAIKPMRFRSTWYCHDNRLDPTGGGFTTASGLRVRYGLCATDNRHWPIGTVFFCRELGISLVVADNGPAVRGPRHVDVCVLDAATRDKVRAAAGGDCGHLTLYHLGRISIREVDHPKRKEVPVATVPVSLQPRQQ